MAAEVLRRMGEQYYQLAIEARARGEWSLPASHQRVYDLFRDAVEEVETGKTQEDVFKGFRG